MPPTRLPESKIKAAIQHPEEEVRLSVSSDVVILETCGVSPTGVMVSVIVATSESIVPTRPEVVNVES